MTELEKKLKAALQAEDPPAATAPEAPAPEEAAAVENFVDETQLRELRLEKEALQDQLLRARAEFDNYRKRTGREMEQLRVTATVGLLRDLLPVLDNLERALGHAQDPGDGLAQGVDMVLKQFSGVLGAAGLQPIAAKDLAFDPAVHDAIAHFASETCPPDTVIEECERGYRLGDLVLRPSKVVVSSGPESPVTRETPDQGNNEEASDSDTTVEDNT